MIAHEGGRWVLCNVRALCGRLAKAHLFDNINEAVRRRGERVEMLIFHLLGKLEGFLLHEGLVQLGDQLAERQESSGTITEGPEIDCILEFFLGQRLPRV